MVVPTARRIVALTALVTALTLATTTNAAPMFTVTNLGSNYTLQQDASGSVHSVTSGDGSRTYAFEKSPVSYNPNPRGGNWQFQKGTYNIAYQTTAGLQYTVTVASNQAGSVGYYLYGSENLGRSFEDSNPTAYTSNLVGGKWNSSFNRYGALGNLADGGFVSLPVKDLNSSGQVVGETRYIGSDGKPVNTPGQLTVATFSDKNFISHEAPYSGTSDIRALTADDLNNYIASDLGIFLLSAVKIDDSGQIIALGMLSGSGKPADFLLTPNASPTPAPEPSTLALLVVGVTALGIRATHRRRERHSTSA